MLDFILHEILILFLFQKRFQIAIRSGHSYAAVEGRSCYLWGFGNDSCHGNHCCQFRCKFFPFKRIGSTKIISIMEFLRKAEIQRNFVSRIHGVKMPAKRVISWWPPTGLKNLFTKWLLTKISYRLTFWVFSTSQQLFFQLGIPWEL